MIKTENKKYRKLIDTGKELFFRHGIKRVTIEEICEKSDVSKMTYYKHFSNKRDLVIKILDELIDEGYNKYNAIFDKEITFIEKIKSVIEFKLEAASEYSQAFIEEAGKSDSYIYKYLISKTADRTNSIEEMYNIGIKEKSINPKYSREFFIYMMYKTGDLYSDESIIKLYPDKELRLSVILNFFFFGIMGKSE
jgi:AcrR family transcriptional regulator